MSLNKALENMKYDKRLLDLNLRLGRLSKDEYDKHVQSLENLESQVEKLDLEQSNDDSND